MTEPNLLDPPVRTILRVSASARRTRSRSRELTDLVLERLTTAHPDARVVERDLGLGIELLDESWVAANLTPETERDEGHRARLAQSDALIGELERADVVVLGVPIYNFGVPAALKAWIDLVARSRRTFRHTPDGPVGLLEGKRAIVVMVSGGTPIGGAIDFASGHLAHVLEFIGITDVAWVKADRLFSGDTEARMEGLREEVRALVPAPPALVDA